jgi:protein-S-isoprenylcysteine O-methyltransferase Ste14
MENKTGKIMAILTISLLVSVGIFTVMFSVKEWPTGAVTFCYILIILLIITVFYGCMKGIKNKEYLKTGTDTKK